MTTARRKAGPSRLTVCRRVLWQPFTAILLGSYTVLAFLNWLKSEFLPAWLQEKLQLIGLIAFLADLPWHWWAIGFLLLLLGVTLEGSYRAVSALEPDQHRTAVARHRAKGVQLFARPVTSRAEMDTWSHDYDTWDQAAKRCLEPFSELTRLKFENIGPLHATHNLSSFDGAHNHRLMVLGRQLEILQEIAEGG
jgi:hypothetical protein